MRLLRTAIANLAVIAAGTSLVTVVEPGAWLAWVVAVSTGIFLIMAVGRKAGGTTRLWWLPLPLAAAFAGILILRLAAPSELFAGFLPTRATWEELRTHLETAAATIRYEAAPVPAETGVVIAVLVAVAIVALIVDLFVFQAHTPAFAALPLLALWTPTLILAREISPVIVLVSFLSWLLLFAAERPWQRQRSIAALHASWVVGAATAVFLIIALVAIPILENWGQWRSVAIEKNRTGSGAITAGSAIFLDDGVVLSHILSERSDQTVMRYRASGTSPSVLRLKVMSEYEDGQWLGATSPQDPLEHSELTDTDASQAGTSELEVQHTGLVEKFGVNPGRVIGMGEDSRAWRMTADTGELLHIRGNISRPYEVVWDSRSPTRSDLEQAPSARAVDERWTQMPSELPPSFYEELARAKGDASTAYETAVNLQNWFRSDGDYSYEVTNDEVTGEALEDFFITRTGFCVHYATAMTLMLRQEGIPARVVVGFLPGKRGHDGWVEVAANRAHAWPEVYFEGYGWMRFEPTPAEQTGRVPNWARTQSAADDIDVDIDEEEERATAEERVEEREDPDADRVSQGARDEDSESNREINWWLLGAGTLVIMAAAATVALRRRSRILSELAQETIWQQARRICRPHAPEAVDRIWEYSRPPSDVAGQLADHLPPDMAQTLAELARALEDVSFAPRSQAKDAQLRALISQLRRSGRKVLG